MQVAYRIRVATTAAALRTKPDLWDSGRVESAVSTGVPYGGAALTARQRVWWTVNVWDDSGASADALTAATWEMALLTPADWSATWIAAETVEDRADRAAGMPHVTAPVADTGKSRLFRLPFETTVAGDVVLTLFGSGFLRNVTIDGRAIEMLPHPEISFGPPAAARFMLPLPAGRHMLAAEMTPPRDFIPAKYLTIAALVRVPVSGGGATRINTGWKTALTAADGWRLAGSSDTGWSSAALTDPQPHPAWPAGPALALRHPFRSDGKPGRARLYIAALGAHDTRINGRPVSEDRLQTEVSDYRRTIPYRCYDVTDLVRAGDNVLAAIVGDGWYASYMAPTGRYPLSPAHRSRLAHGPPRRSSRRNFIMARRMTRAWNSAAGMRRHSTMTAGSTAGAPTRRPASWSRRPAPPCALRAP